MDQKEYYKIYLQDGLEHAPRPLFLGHMCVEPPFDSHDYKPPKSYYLFVYTLSGVGLLESDEKVCKLPPGSAFLFKFPSERRRFFLSGDMGVWTSIYLEFDAGALEGVLEELLERQGIVYELAPEAESVKLLLSYRRKWLDTRHEVGRNSIVLTYRGNIGLSGIEGAQLIYRLLAELRPGGKSSRSGRRGDLVNAVCDYVNSHLECPLDIGRMAKDLSVSRGHLTRVFTERMGRTPHQYVVSLKIRLACEFLAEGGMTNQAIAAQLGIGSEFYFYRMFRQATGMTPREFRLSDRQEEIMRSL